MRRANRYFSQDVANVFVGLAPSGNVHVYLRAAEAGLRKFYVSALVVTIRRKN